MPQLGNSPVLFPYCAEHYVRFGHFRPSGILAYSAMTCCDQTLFNIQNECHTCSGTGTCELEVNEVCVVFYFETFI